MATHQQPELPLLFKAQSPAPELLAQGAEALLYKTHYLTPSRPCVLKYRPPKTWRHPQLDARLTRHRILAEARILVRCRRAGIRVPHVLALDWEGRRDEGASTGSSSAEGGWMMVEWINGGTVRAALSAWTQRAKSAGCELRANPAVADLMRRIGCAVGKLHSTGMVHGDLTTSNLMLHQPSETGEPDRDTPDLLSGDVVLIDFGLALGSVQEEDRAVDLYVLERAYGSTHPLLEEYFGQILLAYADSYKGAKLVIKKLDEVRQRGRKKSMIG